MTAAQLDDLGILMVGGEDAHTFLQGQLTCDLDTLEAHHSTLGCHCDHKGRVITLFRCFQHNDHYALIMPKNIIETAQAHLSKYILFSKVTLTLSQKKILGYHGTHPSFHMPDEHGTVLRVPSLTGTRAMIIADEAELPDWNAHTDLCDAPHWHYDDLCLGLPRITPHTIGAFTPHMLNLVAFDAISFTKGCYIGQEIIARTEHLGQIKRRLVRLRVDSPTPPVPGMPIVTAEGQSVGQIADLCPEPNAPHRYQLLAPLHGSAIDAHAALHLNDPNGAVVAIPG